MQPIKNFFLMKSFLGCRDVSLTNQRACTVGCPMTLAIQSATPMLIFHSFLQDFLGCKDLHSQLNRWCLFHVTQQQFLLNFISGFLKYFFANVPLNIFWVMFWYSASKYGINICIENMKMDQFRYFLSYKQINGLRPQM